ncbi:MAG: Bug family tripartite tricarboxylate transporter substrate binding protein [Lautropia sp.]
MPRAFARFASVAAWLTCAAFASSVLTAAPASAQTFPSKTVKIVVPYPAGGGGDIMARLLAEAMRADLGQSIVVENKPGAGGAIGTAEVARSTPDGHTVLLTAGGFVIAPSILPNAGYDPVKDFVGVSQIAIVPLLLVTRPDSPLNSLADLLKKARAEGSKVSFGSFGNGTPSHLVGEAINQIAGVKMTHVPYKGGMQALPDVVSGTVDVGILDAVSTLPLVRQGRVKAIAVTGPKRLPALPDMPTLVESGIDFDAVGWHGVFAPAAVPAAVVERLNAAFNKAVATPAIRERIVSGGSVPIEPATSAAQWTAQVRQQVAQWAAIVKATGAKAE